MTALLLPSEVTGEGQMVDVGAPPDAELRFCDYHVQYYHATGSIRGLVGAFDSFRVPLHHRQDQERVQFSCRVQLTSTGRDSPTS